MSGGKFSAVTFKSSGSSDVLEVSELTKASGLARDEVSVQVLFCGVNMVDIYVRKGLYPIHQEKNDMRLGFEFIGKVLDFGEDVQDLKYGDVVVCALGRVGAYSSWHVARRKELVKVSDDLDVEEVITVFVKGLTARMLLGHISIARNFLVPQAKSSCLIHSSGSGTGFYLLQMAKALNIEVIGIVSTEEKQKICETLGIKTLIWKNKDETLQDLKTMKPMGFDVVFDGNGQSTIECSIESAKKNGLVVLYGSSTGGVQNLNVQAIATKSLFFCRPKLIDFISEPNQLQAEAESLFNLLRRKEVIPQERKIFKLNQVKEAHEYFESRSRTHAILLQP